MTNSRAKGKRGELEAAAYLSSLFSQPCRRGQQYSGLGGADVVGLPGIHVEVKRTERFNAYSALEQSRSDAGQDETPIVLHRRNRKPWIAVLEADDLINLTANILHLAQELNNRSANANGESNEPNFIN